MALDLLFGCVWLPVRRLNRDEENNPSEEEVDDSDQENASQNIAKPKTNTIKRSSQKESDSLNGKAGRKKKKGASKNINMKSSLSSKGTKRTRASLPGSQESALEQPTQRYLPVQ